MPQSQTAALPRPQEEEETDKSKLAQTEVLPCVILFLCFSVHLALGLPRLGKKRVNLSAFRTFVRFVLVWISRFPLPLGVWEGLRFVIEALFSYLLFFIVPTEVVFFECVCRLLIFVLDSNLATLWESNCPFGFPLVMFPLGSSYFVFVLFSL